MKVKDFIDIVRAGELKNKSSAKDAQSDETLCAHINLGLIELCKRFPIFYKEAIINLNSQTQFYNLPIGVLSVAAVYDGNGQPVAVNENSWRRSVFTPTANRIQVPFADDNEKLWITYKASPQKRESYLPEPEETRLINYELFNDKTDNFGNVTEIGEKNIDLFINDSLLEALGAYVAWRSSMSLMPTIPADSKTMYQFFEASCQRVMFDASVTPEGVFAERLYALHRRGLDTHFSNHQLNRTELY